MITHFSLWQATIASLNEELEKAQAIIISLKEGKESLTSKFEGMEVCKCTTQCIILCWKIKNLLLTERAWVGFNS